MQLGPIIYRECPHCCQLVDYGTLESGNTFGATRWTDGKMDAPMLPNLPEVVGCPQCTRIFWLEEAKLIGEHDWFNEETPTKPVEWKKSTSVCYHETADFFVEALKAGLGSSREKEKYLRSRLWWILNDPVRKGERSTILPPEQEALFFENLKQLSQLLEGRDGADQIMRAEIARECGDFEKCIVRLAVIQGENAAICEQIRSLAQERIWVVYKL